MLQDYDTSFSRLYFSQPRFSSPPLSLSLPPFRPFSPLSLPDPSLYIVSRSTCCQVQAAVPYTPHLRVKFALVADFTISDTRNRKFTNRETENPQTEHTIIATVKSLDDCSSQSSLKQTHEIILIVHPIEISDYVPRKI
ncbi:hypothetical protein TNCV_4402891 [Trichonephila clavipes]|uniref:Uncharacterized protein n=1 Tax=Trichonephila clavipes TaxID=2585209 RepID=A0A8X6SA69_TRICX|nr:hypothetical protein TNCV_4402891 [Trichonephila clavipes]